MDDDFDFEIFVYAEYINKFFTEVMHNSFVQGAMTLSAKPGSPPLIYFVLDEYFNNPGEFPNNINPASLIQKCMDLYNHNPASFPDPGLPIYNIDIPNLPTIISLYFTENALLNNSIEYAKAQDNSKKVEILQAIVKYKDEHHPDRRKKQRT